MHLSEKDYAEYRSRPIESFRSLDPKWAYGTNCDKLLDFSQHPAVGSYRVFLVKTVELIAKTEFYNFNPEVLFTGEEASDYRVITTLKRWEQGEFVDPPIVSVNRYKDRLSIPDGRHRTKLAYNLGYTQIPVAVHEDWIETIGKIIELN